LPTAEKFHILSYNNSGNNSQRSTNAAEIVRGMRMKRVKTEEQKENRSKKQRDIIAKRGLEKNRKAKTSEKGKTDKEQEIGRKRRREEKRQTKLQKRDKSK
jgi:hypothetical protein